MLLLSSCLLISQLKNIKTSLSSALPTEDKKSKVDGLQEASSALLFLSISLCLF